MAPALDSFCFALTPKFEIAESNVGFIVSVLVMET